MSYEDDNKSRSNIDLIALIKVAIILLILAGIVLMGLNLAAGELLTGFYQAFWPFLVAFVLYVVKRLVESKSTLES
ncbi:MAG: hypothetical protein GPJ54_19605 [Candidatus Heimdallarchaeota archaeon]|nr:hypothetical protein [Candidatus Heimdallarchaeota archaeon]